MLLALLMLVAGRLGGAEDGPPGPAGPILLAVETERNIGGGTEPAGPGTGGDAPPSVGTGVEPVRGGGAEAEAPGGGGVPDGGRGVPLGGGGVAVLGALSSAPAALLTHRFWSGS